MTADTPVAGGDLVDDHPRLPHGLVVYGDEDLRHSLDDLALLIGAEIAFDDGDPDERHVSPRVVGRAAARVARMPNGRFARAGQVRACQGEWPERASALEET